MKTADTPSIATVAAQLQASLVALLTAEAAVLAATGALLEAKGQLALAERAVLLQEPSPLTGSNETIRTAQLEDRTVGPRLRREQAEWARIQAGSALEGARATFTAAKALARLLVGPGE